MTYVTTPEHGLKLLKLAQDLKFELHRLGPNGLVSFAKACILYGIDQAEEIVAEACALGGDHLENEMDTILMEGENIHWRKGRDGSLELIA